MTNHDHSEMTSQFCPVCGEKLENQDYAAEKFREGLNEWIDRYFTRRLAEEAILYVQPSSALEEKLSARPENVLELDIKVLENSMWHSDRAEIDLSPDEVLVVVEGNLGNVKRKIIDIEKGEQV